MKGKYDIENFIIAEPGTIMRWGTPVIFIFFLILLIAASSFGYNEIITGEVIVTSENPPVIIRARKEGRISGINYKSGEKVYEGAVLATMMHDADEKDIAFLVSNLQSNKPEPGTLEELNHNFPAALSLGTLIQPYYSTFLNLYQQIILDESLNNEFILEKGLNDQIRNQERAILNKEAELVMANQAVFLVNGNLQRHQNLYSKGILSKVDLEKVEMESLAEERQIQFLEQQLNELVSVLKGLEYRQQLSKNMEFRNASLQKSELSLARQDLLNAIAQWEELYLFKSPIQGTLTFFDVWGKFQNLKPGEDIFTITPFGSQILIAKCSLPVANSGKLQKGQKGVIKLKNYPFREWGVLKARVETISGISRKGEEPGYVVYLKMDDLVTSYGKKLDFEQELLGTAEIILEETTVLGRIFNDFRHLWSGRQI